MFVQLSASAGKKPNPSGIYVLDQAALWHLIDLQKDSGGLHDSRNRREVLKRFLNRAWIRRAWVYQGAVVAADVEIVCSYLHLRFEFIAGLALSTYSLVKGEDDGKCSKEIRETKALVRCNQYDMTDSNSIKATLLTFSSSCGVHENIPKLRITETWSTHSSATILPIKMRYFLITLSLWANPNTPELWRIIRKALLGLVTPQCIGIALNYKRCSRGIGRR